jgi:hypothetical protein
MVQIAINNKLLNTSINHKIIFFGLILIIYYVWMDIALFVHLQRWSPPPMHTSSSNSNEFAAELPINKSNQNNIKQQNIELQQNVDPFTVFKPLSVKLIMIDHATHYVHDILARFVEDTLHFTHMFPWVTANLVSFAGLAAALIGSRMILSDNLCVRQAGALLFELRNFADSLDGVVYRSKKREHDRLKLQEGTLDRPTQANVYRSEYGSYGYNVDVICDGLGGFFFVLAIFIRFLRHLPHKSIQKFLKFCKQEIFAYSKKIFFSI